jgi:hypothetical protein
VSNKASVDQYRCGDRVVCIRKITLFYGEGRPKETVPAGTQGAVIYFPKVDDAQAYNDLGVKWDLPDGRTTCIEVRAEDVVLAEPELRGREDEALRATLRSIRVRDLVPLCRVGGLDIVEWRVRTTYLQEGQEGGHLFDIPHPAEGIGPTPQRALIRSLRILLQQMELSEDRREKSSSEPHA